MTSKARLIDKRQKCLICSKEYYVSRSLEDLNINFFGNQLDKHTTAWRAIEMVESAMNVCSSKCLTIHANNMYGY